MARKKLFTRIERLGMLSLVLFIAAWLAAPLMISVGFPPLAAAIIALQFNSVPVCFGVVGTPNNAGYTTVQDALASAPAVREREQACRPQR